MRIQSTVLLVLIVTISGCKFENVDQGPAVLIGTNFYSSLKSGDVKKSLGFFAPEFKKNESEWPRLLSSLQIQAGSVTSAELQGVQIVANDELPCWLLDYSVKRPGSASNESLLMCRTQDKKVWHISGHKLTRLDNNQSLVGGLIPETVSINSP